MGDAGSTNTNDAANWTITNPAALGCLTTGGGAAPADGDTIIFDADCDTDATVNASLTVSSLQMDSGYTGTVDGSTNTMDINGNVTIAGGTLTATSGTFTVSGNWAKTGGTFTSGSNTVTFDGSSTQTMNSGGTDTGSDFQNLTKSNSSTLQLITNALDIDGTLTISSGTTVDLNALNLTAATLDNPGTLLLEGGETVTITTFDSAEGTVTYDGAGTYTSLAAGNNYYNLTLNGTGSWQHASTLDVNNNLTVTAGTLNSAGQNITLAGNWSNSGTFTSGSNTVTFDGSSAQTLTSGGTGTGQDFNNLTVNKGGGTLSLATNAVDIDGTLTVTAGTFSPGSLATTAGALTVNGGTFTGSSGTVDMNGAVTLSSGTLTAPSGTFTVSGGWTDTASGDQFTPGSNTVTFDGTGTVNANEAFNNATVNASGITITLGAALDADNNLTITAGTLTTSSSNYGVTVGGDFSNSGTFTGNSSTVTFDGGSQTITGSTNTTLYNLTKSVTSAATLTFNNARTTTISNNTTLKGTSGNLLSLRSDSSGTQFEIDASSSGTRDIQYVDVQDSNNTNATSISCTTGCTNSGNNTGWTFSSGSSDTGTSAGEPKIEEVGTDPLDDITVPTEAHVILPSGARVTDGQAAIAPFETITIRSKPIDPDRLQDFSLFAFGQEYPLTDPDGDLIYTVTTRLPGTVGPYPFTITADYGTTTKSAKGTLNVVARPTPPPVALVAVPPPPRRLIAVGPSLPTPPEQLPESSPLPEIAPDILPSSPVIPAPEPGEEKEGKLWILRLSRAISNAVDSAQDRLARFFGEPNRGLPPHLVGHVYRQVHIRIADAAGTPLVGATVTLLSEPQTTITDETGTTTFRDVPAGQHTLKIAQGKNRASERLTLAEDKPIMDVAVTASLRPGVSPAVWVISIIIAALLGAALTYTLTRRPHPRR